MGESHRADGRDFQITECKMSRHQKRIFVVVLSLAAILLFFRLGRHDMLGDDATYAFRSISYVDYMSSETQTTPLQWFGERPSWSLLSFHDHPPVYFLTEHLFFRLFGISVLTSRLLSAVAALGTSLVVFFIAYRQSGFSAGVFSAVALVLNNHFIWTGRVGFLESLFIFFMICGLFFFLKSLRDQKYFPVVGIFFSLALMTKYTFLFVLPPVFIFLLWRHRWVF